MLDLLNVLGDEDEEVLGQDAYQGFPSTLASCWAPGRTGLETSGRFACKSHGPDIFILAAYGMGKNVLKGIGDDPA